MYQGLLATENLEAWRRLPLPARREVTDLMRQLTHQPFREPDKISELGGLLIYTAYFSRWSLVYTVDHPAKQVVFYHFERR